MEEVCHGGITKKLPKNCKQIIMCFLPILDGHAGCDRQYTTIENNALVIYTPKVRHIWRCISVTVAPFPIFPSRKALFYAVYDVSPMAF